MKRRKQDKEEAAKLKGAHHPRISHATKQSVTGILLLGLAIILLLARFEKAGPVGAFIFRTLHGLLGWGYYLVPLIAVIIALLFIASHERKPFGMTAVGAIASITAGLGLIDLIFPERGGLLGTAIGTLEIPFGKTAALVVTAMFFVIGLLVAFNTSLRVGWPRPKEKPEPSEPEEIEPVIAEDAKPAPAPKKAPAEHKEEEDGEQDPVIASAHDPRKMRAVNRASPLIKTKNYVAPPLDLLSSTVEKPTSGDLRANANIIKRTLESFGIPVEMGEINIGPKVTRYTLKPAEGVKLTRITALNQDLALALAAHPIRIEAPIPGKSLVGIEVPNKAAAIVRLGSLMAYPDFKASGPISFIIGRDVSGEPIFGDIEKMPHLLIAGSTGSGKSVAIHSLIVSLLYKNGPDTLRLILIDPKRVELSVYEDIPHLIAPVITENKKTIGVFRWAIHEMERRYELLLSAGARDIRSYHKSIAEKTGEEAGESLPYLLIVIDELADLMASYGKEVEGSIVRLAQMARATGIHLIVSTQRPSVEVITGLIKANITARIALQVASQIDSRTILDGAGAEKLLGGGDLLFQSAEHPKPKRIQGAYISEEEIKRVAAFIREHNEPDVDTIALEGAVEGAVGAEHNMVFDEFAESGDGDDELFEEAVRVVREAKKASASLLQRRLKVGYARAARLLDIMEEKGIVGPGEGAKPRDVF